MNADEIAITGIRFVKDALLDKGVKSLTIGLGDDGQIRFRIEVDNQDVTFAVDVEPFLPVSKSDV